MDSGLFEKQKSSALTGVDLSRKGSVDAPIQSLIEFINNEHDYFTTSSCSGRIIVFDDETDDSTEDVYVKKKGCKWLFTSHDFVTQEEVIASLHGITGDVVFKFEPFVLHVQCKALQDAQNMLSAAVASGFRNSGISIGKKGKTVVAVRSTHMMEVPLSHKGTLLVTNQYINFLIELANKKMKENFKRIDRFFDNLKEFPKNTSIIGDENALDSVRKKEKIQCKESKYVTKGSLQNTKDKSQELTQTTSQSKEIKTVLEEELADCCLFKDESVT